MRLVEASAKIVSRNGSNLSIKLQNVSFEDFKKAITELRLTMLFL